MFTDGSTIRRDDVATIVSRAEARVGPCKPGRLRPFDKSDPLQAPLCGSSPVSSPSSSP